MILIKRHFGTWIAITFLTMVSWLHPAYAAELPELTTLKGNNCRVTIDAWILSPEGGKKHYLVDTQSSAFVDSLKRFFRGLDCKGGHLEPGVAAGEVVNITFHGEPACAFAIMAREYLVFEDGPEYVVGNVKRGDSLERMFLRDVLLKHPELLNEKVE
ncbi:hypothetical protein [Roseimicrobium sp. ORNL1]|uniref:hypothetical protein n=1 Tax=Roseimicrobium sp. ORNL1 TaxID=2711231 RepID=UPI0013E1DFAD|nr:hypothetical protein [Roseimicrobium sp. ORNL1]QIF03062.1 hypothetical protein G5S37_16550 [Roseimicrobium sp. ORNL1]